MVRASRLYIFVRRLYGRLFYYLFRELSSDGGSAISSSRSVSLVSLFIVGIYVASYVDGLSYLRVSGSFSRYFRVHLYIYVQRVIGSHDGSLQGYLKERGGGVLVLYRYLHLVNDGGGILIIQGSGSVFYIRLVSHVRRIFYA